MVNSIEEYLRQLKHELTGCDKAAIQDALSDTEEYLRNAVEQIQSTHSGISEADALNSILEKYGTPAEVAAGYHDIEKGTEPYYSFNTHREKQTWFTRYFGVISDSRAWSALIYLLLSVLTGIIYFGWMAAGISTIIGTLIYIVGIPLAGLFILSIRGLALVEGRFIETLLGIRMPHRPIFTGTDQSLWGRFKSLILDRYTWSTMAYMLLQLPLGAVYFSFFALLIAVPVWWIFQPLWALIPGYQNYFLPFWAMMVMIPAGICLFPASIHMARIVGRWHGTLAKSMLVKE